MGKRKLGEFVPQRQNANKHTQRGLGMLERAMRTSGYVAPMTATADGEVIDGSARLEVAAEIFDGVEPIVVDHDGTRPIIMRRTDIPDASDPRAKRIALEANRVAAVDLEWDAAVLADIVAELPGVAAELWRDDELAAVLAGGLVDFEPGGIEDQGRLDERATVRCPECGHEFTP